MYRNKKNLKVLTVAFDGSDRVGAIVFCFGAGAGEYTFFGYFEKGTKMKYKL